MDYFYDRNISEIKQSYTTCLVNVLTPFLYEGIKSVYQYAINADKEYLERGKYDPNIKSPGILKLFQLALKEIPSLNNNAIKVETQRIKGNCQCTEWFDSLVRAVFKSHIVLFIFQSKKRRNDILKEKYHNKISIENFIHQCYIKSTTIIWDNPTLFWHEYPPLDIKRNQRYVYKIIKDSIQQAIIEVLPMEVVLKEYLHNDFVDDNILDVQYMKIKEMIQRENLSEPDGAVRAEGSVIDSQDHFESSYTSETGTFGSSFKDVNEFADIGTSKDSEDTRGSDESRESDKSRASESRNSDESKSREEGATNEDLCVLEDLLFAADKGDANEGDNNVKQDVVLEVSVKQNEPVVDVKQNEPIVEDSRKEVIIEEDKRVDIKEDTAREDTVKKRERIVVKGNNYDDIISSIREKIEEMGEKPVKGITNQGYVPVVEMVSQNIEAPIHKPVTNQGQIPMAKDDPEIMRLLERPGMVADLEVIKKPSKKDLALLKELEEQFKPKLPEPDKRLFFEQYMK